MIEIIVREDIDVPQVVRVSGKLPQIHIKPGMNLDQLRVELAGKLSTAEFQKFEKLWSDDNYPRHFAKEGDYLKIMDKK